MKEYLISVVYLVVLSVPSHSILDVVYTYVGGQAVLLCEVGEWEVLTLQWIQSDRPVLTYRDGRIERERNNEFKDRVQLQDQEIKNGNLNLILQDVTMKDSGIYRCEAYVQPSREMSGVNQQEIVCEIQLIVSEQISKNEPSNNEPNNKIVAPWIFSFVALVCSILALIIYWKIAQIKQQQESILSNTPVRKRLNPSV